MYCEQQKHLLGHRIQKYVILGFILMHRLAQEFSRTRITRLLLFPVFIDFPSVSKHQASKNAAGSRTIVTFEVIPKGKEESWQPQVINDRSQQHQQWIFWYTFCLHSLFMGAKHLPVSHKLIFLQNATQQIIGLMKRQCCMITSRRSLLWTLDTSNIHTFSASRELTKKIELCLKELQVVVTNHEVVFYLNGSPCNIKLVYVSMGQLCQ